MSFMMIRDEEQVGITQSLVALQEEFESTLAAKIEHLASMLVELKPSNYDDDGFDNVIRQVHMLRGSAGAFGWPGISEAMGRIEILLEQSQHYGNQHAGTDIWTIIEGELAAAQMQIDAKALLARGLINEKDLSVAELNFTCVGGDAEQRGEQVLRILLVEDDLDYSRYVSLLVNGTSQPRFELDVAESLTAAIQHLRCESPDIVLLNLSLPDSSGIASLTRILEVGWNVPVVILTSSDDSSVGLESVAAGAQDYLVKQNISSDGLLRCIRYSIERKKAEDSRLRLAAIEDFMATLAHDLQVPLIGSDHALHGLLNGQLGALAPEQGRLLRILRDSNSRMLALVRKLLEIYRYESMEPRLSFTSVEAGNLIEVCLEEFGPFIRAKGIKIETRFSSDLKSVYGDKQALRLLFSNLIDNAIKFNQKDGAVRIFAENVKQGVMIRIQNSGEYTLEGNEAQLFQHFWKGIPGKRYVATIGTGLYLCYRILTLHQGSIRCSSSAAEGTTFTVILPASSK